MASFILNFGYDVLVLALLTMGLAISMGLLGVLNIAHGEMVMLGGYTAFAIQQLGLPYLASIPVAIVVTGFLGLLAERLIIRPLNYDAFTTLLGTWGLGMALRELVKLAWGNGFQSVAIPISGTVSVFGEAFPAWRLTVLIAALVIIAAAGLWYVKASAALRVRAMVSNPVLAQALGINSNRLATSAFVISCSSAGLAGALIAPTSPVEPSMGVLLVVNSFFSLVVGGFGTLLGLLSGSAIIGGSQNVLSTQFTPSVAYLAVLILAILFLWKRPRGLFSLT